MSEDIREIVLNKKGVSVVGRLTEFKDNYDREAGELSRERGYVRGDVVKYQVVGDKVELIE